MARKERIYIVPTWYGLAYVAGLVLAFFQGALAGNQLIYLLGFCLVTFFLVGMFQTNNNLKGVEITSVEATPGPAEGHVPLIITVANSSPEPRFALAVQFVIGDRRIRASLPLLRDNATERIELVFPAGPRGKHRLPRLQLITVFPMGLFFAWKWKNLESKNGEASSGAGAFYFVYPKPQGNLSLRQTSQSEARKGKAWSVTGDDFSGHRPYQKGDSQRLIDWKARARKLPWLVKKFDEGEGGAHQLRWGDLAGIPTESRLSQLSLWVHECQKRGETYSLELPEENLSTGSGTRHFFDCLRLLASFASKHELTDSPAKPSAANSTTALDRAGT